MADSSGKTQNQPTEPPPVAPLAPEVVGLITTTIQSATDGNLSRLNRELTRGLRKETDKIPGQVQDIVDRALGDVPRGETYAPGLNSSGPRLRRRAPLYDDEPDDGYDDGGSDPRLNQIVHQNERLINRLETRDAAEDEAKAKNEKRAKVRNELGKLAQVGGVHDFWQGDVNREYRRRVSHLDDTLEDWDEAYDIGVHLILETTSQRATLQARQAGSQASERVDEAVTNGRQVAQAAERGAGVNLVEGGQPSSGPTPRVDTLQREVRRSAIEGKEHVDMEEMIRQAKRGNGALVSEQLRS